MYRNLLLTKEKPRLLPGHVFLLYFCMDYSAFPTEPKSSIFSFTVALIASAPGASNLRGSNPFPSKSLPASMYFLVASANES